MSINPVSYVSWLGSPALVAPNNQITTTVNGQSATVNVVPDTLLRTAIVPAVNSTNPVEVLTLSNVPSGLYQTTFGYNAYCSVPGTNWSNGDVLYWAVKVNNTNNNQTRMIVDPFNAKDDLTLQQVNGSMTGILNVATNNTQLDWTATWRPINVGADSGRQSGFNYITLQKIGAANLGIGDDQVNIAEYAYSKLSGGEWIWSDASGNGLVGVDGYVSSIGMNGVHGYRQGILRDIVSYTGVLPDSNYIYNTDDGTGSGFIWCDSSGAIPAGTVVCGSYDSNTKLGKYVGTDRYVESTIVFDYALESPPNMGSWVWCDAASNLNPTATSADGMNGIHAYKGSVLEPVSGYYGILQSTQLISVNSDGMGGYTWCDSNGVEPTPPETASVVNLGDQLFGYTAGMNNTTRYAENIFPP